MRRPAGRWSTVSAVLVFGAAAAGSGAAPVASPASSRCRQPSGTTLVLHTSRVLVWRTGGGANGRIVACERPAGDPHVVRTAGGFYSDVLAGFRAAGSYIAVTDDSSIVSSQTSGDALTLVVFDVHRGRTAFAEQVAGSTTCCGDCAPSCKPDVTTLQSYVINRHGFGAWVTEHLRRQTLSVHDHRSTREIVHRATDIARLAFHGDFVTWTAGRRRYSLRLR